LVITGVEGIHPGQARLTFAMARHAAVDLAQVVNARYDPQAPERLADDAFNALRETLAAAGLKLRTGDEAKQKLKQVACDVEPYVHSTARRLMVALPPWQHPGEDSGQLAGWPVGPDDPGQGTGCAWSEAHTTAGQ